MHTKSNFEIKKRHELQKFSEVVVKVSEKELKWLTPFGEKLLGKVMLKPLEHKTFTVKEHDHRWETILVVHEESPGKISVYGYPPTNLVNKSRSVNDENPFFHVTVQNFLGTIKCTDFKGDRHKCKEAEICYEIMQRIVPIILYMQDYSSYAIVSKRKITVGTGKFKHVMEQKNYTLRKFENSIPEKFESFGKVIKVAKPKFLSFEEMEEGIWASIESRENITWLQQFSNEIRVENRTAAAYGKKIDAPFYEESIIKNIPVVRIYTNAENRKEEFIQLQIRYNHEANLYQIDYYDEDCGDKCQMIIFAKLDSDPAIYDIAYVSENNGDVTATMNEYAQRIITLYTDVLTYFRPYEMSKKKELVTVSKIKIPESWGCRK